MRVYARVCRQSENIGVQCVCIQIVCQFLLLSLSIFHTKECCSDSQHFIQLNSTSFIERLKSINT